MTTATATTEGQEDRTGTEMDLEDGRTPTESILTGQDGDEAVDSAEAEAAMLAGWKKVGNNATATKNDDEEDITDVVDKKTTTQESNDDVDLGEEGDATATSTTQQDDNDPVIAGLGMKASEVKAQLARVATLEKSLASTSGHLGHLKQLVSQAGQGKKVTAESLKKVSEEFGPEFAQALAEDLSTAGFGSGSSVDPATIEQMVNEQVSSAQASMRREFEKKTVLRAHPDADDHFARPKLDANGNPVTIKDKDGQDVPQWEPGPKHAAFMAFVQTLPAARQQELFSPETGWDSSVVSRALDDFKAHEKKAANQQAVQTTRMQRAVAPKGRSGEAQQPATDPLMQGWNNVRGRRAAGPASSGGRSR